MDTKANTSEIQKKQSEPYMVKGQQYRYDAFQNGEILLGKKKNHLPAMGWNSWNAFGSGNTEALTKEMADAIISLELDQAGYQYVVLDDGCYKPERVDEKLSNETEKFPSGFKALSDYIHEKGLKFGMYNDIGTNLCAGAAVGTCFHEMLDAQSYIDWGVDFLKVDNCYYLWDNATFSDASNAKYVYAPAIKGIQLRQDSDCWAYSAVLDGIEYGCGIQKEGEFVSNIGTFDGTGPEHTPVGIQSGELRFCINDLTKGQYDLAILYDAGQEVGKGSWLQVAIVNEIGLQSNSRIVFDGFVDGNENSMTIPVTILEGDSCIRIMNHRRQENTLGSYATLLEGLNYAKPEHDIIFSICEWGKTQPQNWGYKIGDSWRILNDITFQVGADGDPGVAGWISDYTTGIASQYNKAVIMDEFAGLDKGWNDPDMLVIGMNGVSDTMAKTHMAMWCMMNAPLMLGTDLRRIKKGDLTWQIIANSDLIALNQDSLGVQAKRIAIWQKDENGLLVQNKQDADCLYIRDTQRVDVLAKPLANGDVALCFINLSESDWTESFTVNVSDIVEKLSKKMVSCARFENAGSYCIKNLVTKETVTKSEKLFCINGLKGYDSVTLRICPEGITKE